MVIDEIMAKVKVEENGLIQNGDGETVWPFTDDKVVVGFDCEGINLGVKGQLTLMQIATMAGYSYIFDLISCPQMVDNGLRQLLESHNVIKVIVFKFIIMYVFEIQFNSISGASLCCVARKSFDACFLDHFKIISLNISLLWAFTTASS